MGIPILRSFTPVTILISFYNRKKGRLLQAAFFIKQFGVILHVSQFPRYFRYLANRQRFYKEKPVFRVPPNSRLHLQGFLI